MSPSLPDRGGRRPLTTLVVVLCFVLQQFLVPMHLALHEHTFGNPDASSAEAARHGHTPPLRATALGAPQLVESCDDHAPHPAEDHSEQLTAAPDLSPLAHVTLARCPSGWNRPARVGPERGVVRTVVAESRSAPPLARSASRAPPSFV